MTWISATNAETEKSEGVCTFLAPVADLQHILLDDILWLLVVLS